jgi:DNA-binding transcriptional regulator YhcF (GntR family)
VPEPTLKRILDEIEAHYPVVAADLLEPLLRFMTVARDILGGDAEKILIMLVISVRTKQHPDFVDLTPEQLSSGEMPMLPSLGVNVRSIADSTGIPKETVRRKAAELVDAGFFTRKDGDFRYTAEGYEAVAPAREALERLAARNYQIVSQLLSRYCANG